MEMKTPLEVKQIDYVCRECNLSIAYVGISEERPGTHKHECLNCSSFFFLEKRYPFISYNLTESELCHK